MEFLELYYETRIYASRHLDNSEKNAVVEHIKDSIERNRWSIHKNEKNNKFKQMSGMNYSQIMDIIKTYIQPKNIVCVIPNNNYPKQGSQELYLLKMYIKKFSVYVKVDITEKSAEFWSIHSLTGTLDRDFQYASDYQENNLIKTFVWEWKQKYNEKAPAGFKVISSFINDMTAHFDFECGDVNYDNAGKFLNLFMSSIPHRLYQIKNINGHIQLDLNAGGVDVELEEK